MNLCRDGHEEICFEGRKCPLCDMRDDLQSEIDDRDKKILDQEKTINEIREDKS